MDLPLPDEGRSPWNNAVEMRVRPSPRPVSTGCTWNTPMTHKLRPTYYVERKKRFPMLFTQRLDLIEGTPESIRAAIDDVTRLGELLHARIPADWPPELLDVPALEWTLRWYANPENDPAFGMYWIVLRESAASRTLVGAAGFKGVPSEDGTVEIGYGVVPEYQRRGYATETVRAFLTHAFASPKVTRVIAETYPNLAASIGVLEKCGFTFIGDGSEPGVVRYEIKPTVTSSRVSVVEEASGGASSTRTLMRFSLVGAALVSITAAVPAQVAGKFPPDSLLNTQVIPRSTPVIQVVGQMRNITFALGVRCQFCHIGEEGKPLEQFDFASDQKRNKLVARQMMRMVARDQSADRHYS